ncbi:uncharacterized protein perm1b [Genypterus blacodes]|uniref:uncharacterized protein perm1b n=1 Tax=Genypterus blacodes TaxID=154954 RepID=UPI003F77603A
MDDLDHSMLVAENDWMRFFEESEECSLLQPSLASLDGPAVRVSEDLQNPDSVFKTNQHEAQQSPDRDESQSGDAGGHSWMDSTNQSRGLEDITIETKEVSVVRNHVAQTDSEICLDDPGDNEAMHVENAEQITETTNDRITCAQPTEATNGKFSAELEKGGEHVQTESGPLNLKPVQDPDPLSCRQAGMNVKVTHTTESTEDTSCVTTRPEKERWFVTINDNPVRNRRQAPSVRKKRRQKILHKDKRVCGREQEPQGQHSSGSEINNIKDESEGENDNEYSTKSDQNMLQNSAEQPNDEISLENIQSELISDSMQMHITPLPCGETEIAAQQLEMSQSLNVESNESRLDGNKCEPQNSVEQPEKPTDPMTSTLRDTFPLLRDMSDEFEDSVEFFSAHSYDSETYLSAAESMDELHQLYLKCSISNDKLFDLTDSTDADNIPGTEMHSGDTHKENFNSGEPAASDCDGYESIADMVFVNPSAGRGTNKTPEDNPACQPPCDSDHVPELQTHNSPTGCGISPSDCLEEEQLKLPVLTVTPCSEVDGPEKYAEALDPARPVFAISAFWDEMEKLTIKDILQLRMGTSPSTTEAQRIQGTAKVNVDVTDAKADHSSLLDTVEYDLADGSLMDTSDAADSDYFTQPDDSKPDRSSCDFSTSSDCEEEYLQFIGASRNPSPDPQNKKQQGQSTNDFSVKDTQEECLTVSLEEITQPRFDNQATHTPVSNNLSWPRRISKSQSMQNVRALNSHHLQEEFQLKSNAEDSLFLRNCPSLEENTTFIVSDSPGALTDVSILTSIEIVNEHNTITFPDMLECLLSEDEVENNCRPVMVYDPREISVYDFTFCTPMHEMLVSSEGKPIPIFSCSHPTVRDLTFPEVDYLFLPQNMSAETDTVSRNNIVACSHLHANDFASSVAAAVAAASNGPHYETHWARSWNGFLSMRNIRFHNTGSMWRRRSPGWVFPVGTERTHIINRAVPAITLFSEGRVQSNPSQIFRELAVEQSILETIQTTFYLTKREGLFSTLKQSDMCLVCIAVASWVLRSTDLEGADGWKAALLANVSALSAIQYLRQYLK